MLPNELVKYRAPVRVLHWIHSGAFVLLFITGFMLYLKRLTFRSLEEWTRTIHLSAAVVFVIVPVIYLIIFPRSAFRGLKVAFSWGKDDFKWLIAAPRFYLLGDEKNMPPQGILNSGQKLWWLLTILSVIVFGVTGATMWFFLKTAPADVLNQMIMAHDIAFIVMGALFLGHIYLGLFNPKMTEALRAMTKGKISAEYAEKYHGKWYTEKGGNEEKNP